MSRNTATIDGSKEKRRYLTLLAGTVALIGSLFIGIAAGAVPIRYGKYSRLYRE